MWFWFFYYNFQFIKSNLYLTYLLSHGFYHLFNYLVYAKDDQLTAIATPAFLSGAKDIRDF
ncbi:hypothetical protein PEC301296_42000 [Pectobacterium carotovorum subsp. carotovorum]|nr:hypothetical protein PEC301296_42000 [Pectobacterium carotovorum subsp. carotovorum]